MFKKDQLESIIKEKNSAFKVLIETQNKLKKSCDKAVAFINLNVDGISKKEEEITALRDSNLLLEDQMNLMSASIKQTDAIINPVVVSEEK